MVGCGNLCRAVAGCEAGVMALLERLHPGGPESWRPGGLESGGLEVRMMRLRRRMRMNDERDED